MNELDRQDIFRAIANIHRASRDERLSYGPYVLHLRSRLGITQEELAEAAGITARTLGNIENQRNAGQAGKLVRIFRALGVELEHPSWDTETERYLAMIAPLIEKINPNKRLEAMTNVIALLTDAIDVADGSWLMHESAAVRAELEQMSSSTEDDEPRQQVPAEVER